MKLDCEKLSNSLQKFLKHSCREKNLQRIANVKNIQWTNKTHTHTSGLHFVYSNFSLCIYTSLFTYAFPYLMFLSVMLSGAPGRPNSRTVPVDLMGKLLKVFAGLLTRTHEILNLKTSEICDNQDAVMTTTTTIFTNTVM